MHRVAGLDDFDDFLAVTVDERDLTGVAGVTENRLSRFRSFIFFLGAVPGNADLPGAFHLLQSPLRRNRRLMLQVSGHHIDFGFAELTGGAPVGHARGRSVGNEVLQIGGAAFAGDVRCQRFTRRTFAQYAHGSRHSVQRISSLTVPSPLW